MLDAEVYVALAFVPPAGDDLSLAKKIAKRMYIKQARKHHICNKSIFMRLEITRKAEFTPRVHGGRKGFGYLHPPKSVVTGK